MERRHRAQEKAMRTSRLLALLGLLCAACGGTDDVEYPALAVTLTNTTGPTTGAVRVYAHFQNPVFDSIPVLDQPSLAGQTSIQITPTVLVNAMTQAHARGIPWPNQDSLIFNLIGLNQSTAAFAPDFLLLRSGSTYHFEKLRGNSWVLNKNVLSGSLPLIPPAVNIHGQVGTLGAQLKLASIFIPGSPYSATVQADGSFILPTLAKGIYPINALSQDSLFYTSQDSLNTDSTFSAGSWVPADIVWIVP
jgi:hypothetical protein